MTSQRHARRLSRPIYGRRSCTMRSHRRQQSHSVPALLVARATRISQRTTNRSALPCAAMKCSSLWEKEPPPKKSAKEQRERKTLTFHDACRWRWRLRQNYSVRVLAKIKQRLDDWQPLSGKNSVTPDSPLGKSVMYSLTRWEQLTHYADIGDIPIDNNPPKTANASSPSAEKITSSSAAKAEDTTPPTFIHS